MEVNRRSVRKKRSCQLYVRERDIERKRNRRRETESKRRNSQGIKAIQIWPMTKLKSQKVKCGNLGLWQNEATAFLPVAQFRREPISSWPKNQTWNRSTISATHFHNRSKQTRMISLFPWAIIFWSPRINRVNKAKSIFVFAVQMDHGLIPGVSSRKASYPAGYLCLSVCVSHLSTSFSCHM